MLCLESFTYKTKIVARLQIFARVNIHQMVIMDVFKFYAERAVEKCPRWNFYTPRKTRNSKNKSGYSIVGHPVIDNHFLKLDFFILIIFSLQKFFTKIFLDNFFNPNFTGTENLFYLLYSSYPKLSLDQMCQPKIFLTQFFSPPNSFGHLHYQDICDTRTPYTS